MANHHVEIERVIAPSPELVEAFSRLVPQLSSATPPTLGDLAVVTDNPAVFLYIARFEGDIVGSLTLATFASPTGFHAWIEDVVVDASCRGNGIASQLVNSAIDKAREIGAAHLNLTSRPSRVAANQLYPKLGFALRDTNVYRLSLDRG